MDTSLKTTVVATNITDAEITEAQVKDQQADTDRQTTNQTKTSLEEEFKISGDALVSEIKRLVHQGNIRRIIIKNEKGDTLIEIPMTVGVIGGVVSAAFFPVLAAVGVIGALVTHLTVVIERQEPDSSEKPNPDEE